MKKMLVLMCAMLLTVSLAFARDKVTKDVSSLPVMAREMIQTHFTNAGVEYLKVKSRALVEGYEVFLSDGSELEFDRKGRWTDVENKHRAVPSSLIPAAVQKYLGTYYPNQRVVEIKQKRRGYELKLVNGLELVFDKKGKFKHLDD